MGGRSLNTQAAAIFRDCAGILRQQKANPFRVNAYVRAAQTLESLDFDVADLLEEEGIEGLIELPTIGRGLATAIDEIARTGRLAQLDRLRGEARPEVLFQGIPGVGPTLAARIHDTLHVDTLEALEELCAATLPLADSGLNRRVDRLQTAVRVLRADAPRKEGRYELGEVIDDIRAALDQLAHALHDAHTGLAGLGLAGLRRIGRGERDRIPVAAPRRLRPRRAGTGRGCGS